MEMIAILSQAIQISISMYDVPRSFATAFVYDLPYGHKKRCGGGALAVIRQILGDWQVAGTVRLTSGLPLLAPFYCDNPLADNFGFPGIRFPIWWEIRSRLTRHRRIGMHSLRQATSPWGL